MSSPDTMPEVADEFSAEAIERKLQQFSDVDRRNLTALLARYQEGNYAQHHEKKLRDAGLIPPLKKAVAEDAGGAEPDEEKPLPETVDKAGDLVVVLNRYFATQIKRRITANHISDWQRGVKLGKVVIAGKVIEPPLLECRVGAGNRVYCRKTAEWFATYILPQHGWRADGESASATDMIQERENHELWVMKCEREDREKAVVPRTDVLRMAAIFGNGINRVPNEIEKLVKRAMVEAGITSEAAVKTAQQANDLARSLFAKAVADAKESVETKPDDGDVAADE